MQQISSCIGRVGNLAVTSNPFSGWFVGTNVKTGLSEPVLDTPGLPAQDSGNQSHLTRNHKEADTKPASLMREFHPSYRTASLLVQIKRDLGDPTYKK